MVGFAVLAVLFVVFAPIIISIVALTKVSTLRNELDSLKSWVKRQTFDSAPTNVTKPDPARPVQEAVKPAPVPTPDPRPVPAQKPITPPRSVSKAQKPKHGVEFLMGGRAAAFIGIGILVIGIALLVGYAIQNSWIGPGARVLLGLSSGLVLVGLGYWVSRLDEKFTIFSRVLTGGGSALFYFTVFASYAFYHLIGPVLSGIGLFICAAAVFGLAMYYVSQSVGVLGVLGAFITPILIGGDLEAGIFPLVYVALINVPVILLGVRRKWQWLYNLAFAFTVIHSLIWMDRLNDADFIPGLIFFIILYLQFAGLGLLKLRHEQAVNGRTVDLIRLILLSLFLLGMVYWLFTETGKNGCGLACALLGLMQLGVAFFSHKILTRFSGESTAFVAGGSFALAMALPVQFDGEWVSLGWGIQGAILAWFALRVRSAVLRAGAFLLGLIGVLKVVVFDATQYSVPPNLFLNARLAVGLISSALLVAQGKLLERYPDDPSAKKFRDIAWWFGGVAIILIAITDVFWTRGFNDIVSWRLTSIILMAFGSALAMYAPRDSSVVWLGRILLLLTPVKAIIFDAMVYAEPPDLLLNGRFVLGALSIALLLLQTKVGLQRDENPLMDWKEISWWAAACSATVLVVSDIFWTLGVDHHASWLLSSVALVAGGTVVAWFSPKQFNVVWLGRVLLLLTPVKILVVDTLMVGISLGSSGEPFMHRVIWFQLVILAVLIFLVCPRLVPRSDDEREKVVTCSLLTNLLSLISGLALLSLEIGRIDSDWADMGITILWALSALGLILFGMKCKMSAHRYLGLALIALATIKVLIVDSSELDGLQRIFAFIGTGVLLLVLAFAYQKASAFFQALEDE